MAIPLAIPIAIGAAKVISSIFGNKAANDKAKAEALVYNEWLKDRSQTVDDIAAKLKANGIDIYGPQISYRDSTAESYSNTVFNQTQKMEKTVGAGQEGMKAKLDKLIQGRLGQTDFISEEEKAASERGINQMQTGANERIRGALARMGGGVSPSSMQAAMLETPGDIAANQARLNAEAGWNATNRAEADKARAEAAGQLAAWQGQTTKTKGSSTTTGSTSSHESATAPPDPAKLLQFLMPPSPQATGKTGQSQFGSALGAGADAAASIYGMYNNPGGGGAAGGAGVPPTSAFEPGGGTWVFRNGSWVKE